MKKRGLKFATIGIIIGVLAGLGIVALRGFIAQSLVSMLDEEARKSCNCRFAVDKVDISLLQLKAVARNPRIESNGAPALYFKRINAYFNIKRIKQHLVDIDLELQDGKAIGIGAQSPAVKFIGSLAAPIAPERDYPGRWKLKLQHLKMFNSKLEDTFSSIKLTGDGISLNVERDSANNFWLEPQISTLQLTAPFNNSQPSPINIGQLSSKLYLQDDIADFQKIKLALPSSWIEGGAKMLHLQKEALQGAFNLQLDSSDLVTNSNTKLSISGQTRLDGNLENPSLSGTFKITPNSINLVGVGKDPLSISKFSTSYNLGYNQNGLYINLPTLSLAGPQLALDLQKPFSLNDGKLSGSASVWIGAINSDSFELKDIKMSANISGTSSNPEITFTGIIPTSLIQGHQLPPLSTEFHLDSSNTTSFNISLRSTQEHFNINGKIVPKNGTYELSDTTYRLNQLDPSFLAGESKLPFLLSGSGSISGPFNINKINSDGKITLIPTISDAQDAISLSMQIGSGVAQIEATNQNKTLASSLKINFNDKQKGSFVLKTLDFQPGSLLSNLGCITISSDSNYSFDLNSFFTGDGSVSISKIQVGCGQYGLNNKAPENILIKGGVLNTNNLQLANDISAITLQGRLSRAEGYNFKIEGLLNLNSLLGVLNSVDDLDGQVAAKIALTGAISDPKLNGSAILSNAHFDIAAANISCEKLNGKLNFTQDKVTLENIRGMLNSGKFTAQGEILPFNLNSSRVTLTLEHILIEPDSKTSLVFSGDIALRKPSQAKPVIEGTLVLESGEFQDSINIQTVVKILADILSAKKTTSVSAPLPDIDLNLSVSATRNLFVITNLATMELALNLAVGGSIPNPNINGSISALSGWLGLKNRRFEITSGNLIFKPDTSIPEIELLGETYITSQSGENVLVLLEARGSINAPKLNLSSDRGLSEREILELLTRSGLARTSTQRSSLLVGIEQKETSLMSDFLSLNLRRIFKNLTRLDSVFFEPIYNPQTGVVEPGVVAEKKLTDSIKLVGESSFGTSTSISRAKAIYDLTPAISVTGLIETDAARKTNPVETNLTYTILSRQNQLLKINIDGNSALQNDNILRAARLTTNSRLLSSDLTRVQNSIQDFYKTQGYYNSRAKVECDNYNTFCESLRININEGTRATLRQIKLQGDNLPLSLTSLQNKIVEISHQTAATSDLLNRKIALLSRALRRDGYIAARIDGSYELSRDDSATLIINLSVGDPVSFTFNGNSKFSPSDFLDTINLFERKQPFGSNTIAILLENIERLYRSAGYLYVSIDSAKTKEPSSNRINYTINIEEGNISYVKSVAFQGISNDTLETIKERLTNPPSNSYASIWHPKYAIAEALDQNVQILQEELTALGFSNSSVSYDIKPLENSNDLNITYTITEGLQDLINTIKLSSPSSTIKLPRAPKTPCSVFYLNEYSENISRIVKDNGYYFSTVTVTTDASKNAIINIDLGEQVIINEFTLEGLVSIQPSVVMQAASLKSGMPLTSYIIDETRRKLLRLGLFSRVELYPSDGSINSSRENLTISLTERSLQSLELGGGANSEYGIHAFGEASDRSLFADGRALSFRLDGYYDPSDQNISQGTANLRFFNPSIANTNFSASEDLRYQKLDLATQEFNLDRTSLASYVYRTTEHGLSTTFGHTLLTEDLNDVSPGAVLSNLDTGHVRLSFMSGAFTWDRRDNPLSSSSGYSFGFDYRISSRAIYSEANYYSSGVRASYFTPLSFINSRLSFAANTKTMAAWSYGSTNEIPITQRYYLGGRSSIRGFKENSLGPKALDGSVIGGDLLFQNNAELRYLIEDNVSLHTFIDIGTVYLRSLGIHAQDLRYSTGLGIRYISPIGPIGLELGLPLDRLNGESSYRIHFSIGSAF